MFSLIFDVHPGYSESVLFFPNISRIYILFPFGFVFAFIPSKINIWRYLHSILMKQFFFYWQFPLLFKMHPPYLCQHSFFSDTHCFLFLKHIQSTFHIFFLATFKTQVRNSSLEKCNFILFSLSFFIPPHYVQLLTPKNNPT